MPKIFYQVEIVNTFLNILIINNWAFDCCSWQRGFGVKKVKNYRYQRFKPMTERSDIKEITSQMDE